METNFKCQWPTGIERLRVRPSNLVGLDVGFTMSLGNGVVGSVHLGAERAVDLCQAVVSAAYPQPITTPLHLPCSYFNGSPGAGLRLDQHEDGTVAVRVQGGLCYLTKEDARAAAVHLLRMCGSVED